ncbi:MAG: hypothetical protein ACHQF4_07835 [Sphingobacteriales bacterium]
MEEVPNKEYTMSKAKGISIAYNMVTFIFLAFIVAENSKPLVAFLISYVLLGIGLMLFSKGSIKFVSNSKKSKAGFTMMGIFFSSFILLLKSFGYTLTSNDGLWPPFLIITVVIFITIYLCGINKPIGTIVGQVTIMLIVSFILGLAITRQANCLFDNSLPQLIHATVESKWVEHSKGTHYHLKLTSWDSNPSPKDIEVSDTTYAKYFSGNTIDVDLKTGLLEIPWFYLHY